jgi:hypothetical protein
MSKGENSDQVGTCKLKSIKNEQLTKFAIKSSNEK